MNLQDVMQVLELYESLYVFAYALRQQYQKDTSGQYNATVLRALITDVPDGELYIESSVKNY